MSQSEHPAVPQPAAVAQEVWTVEYFNDTGRHDDTFREWWEVSSPSHSFRCDSEASAQWLKETLSAPPAEKPAPVQPEEGLDRITRARMETLRSFALQTMGTLEAREKQYVSKSHPMHDMYGDRQEELAAFRAKADEAKELYWEVRRSAEKLLRELEAGRGQTPAHLRAPSDSTSAERESSLISLLQEARDSIESWAAYASEHFQKKHKLAEELLRLDAALLRARVAQKSPQ